MGCHLQGGKRDRAKKVAADQAMAAAGNEGSSTRSITDGRAAEAAFTAGAVEGGSGDEACDLNDLIEEMIEHGPDAKHVKNKAVADLFKKGALAPSSDGVKWDVVSECWLKDGVPIANDKVKMPPPQPAKVSRSESGSASSSGSESDSSPKGFMNTGKKSSKKNKEDQRKAEKVKNEKKEFSD